MQMRQILMTNVYLHIFYTVVRTLNTPSIPQITTARTTPKIAWKKET